MAPQQRLPIDAAVPGSLPPGMTLQYPGQAPEAAAQLPLRRREVASQSNHVDLRLPALSLVQNGQN